MPDINIQFHATPEELSGWIREWICREDITIVALSFAPFGIERLVLDEVRSIFSNPLIRRLSFLIGTQEVLVASSQYEFDNLHTEQLILDVGQLTRQGLGQSWLACRTDNARAFTTWKRIASDVRKRTIAGVVCINRQSGVSDFVKSFRYTKSAESLQSDGIPMLPPQGPNGPMLQLGGTD